MDIKDNIFIQRAFQLANWGKFSVAPNPRVGAVIVHNDKIIGEGYHQVYGGKHAEVNAIESVTDKSLLSQSTIYVSLEPCAHFGKTPPCARLLEECQFKRVVISNKDPFDKVNGNGISILEEAKIKVQSKVLEKEGASVNRRFFTFHQKERPYIILKWARSKDHFIYNRALQNNWITNSISKQLVHLWRAEEAAILVGKNTVITDNPLLTVREISGKNPIRIIIDENLEIPKSSHVLNSDSRTIVLNAKHDSVENGLELLKINTRENLALAVSKICFERNLSSIIVEGGKQILDQFIQAGLWDEARIFTGDKTFMKGVESPIIDGEEVYRAKIESDELLILKNNKA